MSIFLFGFSSGLPFLLTLSTLTIWLKESSINNTTIGFFVLVTIPYTFKFLWGPIVDNFKIPFLSRFLGQRRSWILIAQIGLIFMLVGLGTSNPEKNIYETAFWAFGIALCSSIQDVVIEAYRIEIVSESQRGPAAGATVLGWRIGLMTSGAGALFVAAAFSWQFAYNLMAAAMLIGLFTTILSPSPPAQISLANPYSKLKMAEGFWETLYQTYAQPLKELWNAYDWRMVLGFILFYKVGDTILNVMNTPFLVELGFSKLEIANVAKFFGISAMIVGGFFGGLFLNRFGIFQSLIVCTILQLFSSLMFILQALAGYNLNVLILTVGVENFTCGFGATAFIAFISSLCYRPHTATHFAILSSCGSMIRIILSIAAGILADILSWPQFFALTAGACVPCFFLLIHMKAKPAIPV